MDFLYCWDASVFTFPVNGFAGVFLILGIWMLHRYYASTPLVRRLSGIPTALIVLGSLVILLIVEGIWAFQLFRTWPFIALLFLLLIVLGLAILKQGKPTSIRTILFQLNHAGIWLALFAALFGAPDREEYKMIAPLGQAEYNCIDRAGQLHPLPFTVRLDRFELEYYPETVNARVPKRFCSTLTVKTKEKQLRLQTEVNRPAHFKGYSLYQDGYDTSRGADSQYSILLVVKDPWIVGVYIGIGMLLAGALGGIIYGPIQKIKS